MLNAVKEVEEFMMGLSFEDFCEDTKVTVRSPWTSLLSVKQPNMCQQKFVKATLKFPGPKSWDEKHFNP